MSRLQTGQNVPHFVNQESTHTKWKSAEVIRYIMKQEKSEHCDEQSDVNQNIRLTPEGHKNNQEYHSIINQFSFIIVRGYH